MLPEEELNKNNEVINNSNPQFSRSQKIMAGFLAFFAVFILILWSVQFKKTISGSLNSSATVSNATADNSGSPAEENNDVALKAKDTDGDGLSDYDELYIYKTSPYLEDSDSDGFNDKKELNSNNDPNCPVGRECSSSVLINPAAEVVTASTSKSSLNSLLDQMSTNANSSATTSTGATNANSADLQSVLSGQIDAATLRQLLIQAGMDKTMLDKISDKDLLANYQEVLKNQQ